VNKKIIVLCLMLALFFALVIGVFSLPSFSAWESKDVSRYYMDNSLEKTGSSSVVSAIVWDFRGFDTMGEETVLFTATAGILTLMAVGFRRRK